MTGSRVWLWSGVLGLAASLCFTGGVHLALWGLGRADTYRYLLGCVTIVAAYPLAIGAWVSRPRE